MRISSEVNAQSDEAVRKWAYPIFGLLLAYVLVRSLVAAAGKPFWYDELLTNTVAGLGSWQRIMEALRGPADGQPPLFYVIEHFSSKICANQHIALRLPSAIAFLGAMASVFAFARRLGGNLIAMLSAAALLLTGVFQYYAQEARPYSMVFALIAFAAVCYQRSKSSAWILALAVSLIFAESLHYLAVLAFVPFAAAELSETWKEGRVRVGVWAAIAAGAVPAILSLKLLQLNKAYYGAHHYYSHFSVSSIPGTYAELFGVSTYFGGAVGLTVLAAICVDLVWLRREDGGWSWRETVTADAVLLVGFAALPFVALLFTKATHSAMTSRYVLSTVLGLVLGVAYCMRNAARKTLIVVAVFVAAGVAISELHFWKFESRDRQIVANKNANTAALFAQAGHSGLPVVVPNGGTLLAVVYYAFPGEPQRFVYLQSDGTEKDAEQKDTAERGLMQIQKYVGISVRPKREFFAENSSFLVYVEGMNAGIDSLIAGQLNEGWQVNLVAYDGLRTLYLVNRTHGR